MIEVNINYETFGFTVDQLEKLNAVLREAKLRTRKNGFEEHQKQITAVTTTRWSTEEE